MPTIVREGGFSLRIYVNDHSPPHVHAFKAEGEAKISIEGSVPYLLSSEKMGLKDIKKALRLVRKHQAKLLEHWRDIDG